MKDSPQIPAPSRTPMGFTPKLFFLAAGIVLLVFVFLFLVSSLKDKELTTADQLIAMIKPYSEAYDKANELDVKTTGEQYKIVEAMSKNINTLTDARVAKCYNAKVSEDIRKYFSSSLKLPTGDTLSNITADAQNLCNRNDKFTTVKSEVIKMVDGMVTPVDSPLALSPTEGSGSSTTLESTPSSMFRVIK